MILVVFGTTDGHTQKVAQAIGAACESAGVPANVQDAGVAPALQPHGRYQAVIVAASLHSGGYQRRVRRWVRANAVALNLLPTAFVTVCLGVLQPGEEVQAELDRAQGVFIQRTGWAPRQTLRMAGAIPYTRYGFLKRWIMRRIAQRTGGGCDTTRDYEYTDWAALEAFAREFAAQLVVH